MNSTTVNNLRQKNASLEERLEESYQTNAILVEKIEELEAWLEENSLFPRRKLQSENVLELEKEN